jgi:adenine-specific DNA-methyltransferase
VRVVSIEPYQRTAFARELRRRSTEAEAHLWRRLRNRQVFDWKWRRQEPIGVYFADFACREARLVVEVDGSQHYQLDGETVASDVERSEYIESLGWRVLRFNNRDVLSDTETVLDAILEALGSRPGIAMPSCRADERK